MFKQRDPHDGTDYSNPFGWRVSIIGLIIIGLLAGLAAYRHYSLGVPSGFEEPEVFQGNRTYYQDKADRDKAEWEAKQDTLRKQ